jgi:hypothetical protein
MDISDPLLWPFLRSQKQYQKKTILQIWQNSCWHQNLTLPLDDSLEDDSFSIYFQEEDTFDLIVSVSNDADMSHDSE